MNYQLDHRKYSFNCIKWMYQAFKRIGDPHNYCNNPQFPGEATLQEAWKLQLLDCHIERHSAHLSGTVHQIQIDSTQILEPLTQGHSSRTKHVCTDSKTHMLNRTWLDTLKQEHHTPTPKLSHTDWSTIGLDGRAVSRPCVQALSHLVLSQAPTRPTQPPSTKPPTNKPLPPRSGCCLKDLHYCSPERAERDCLQRNTWATS
ncbi:hypothetical protein FRC12_016058 [Ceratobasidium sp. 428]|nr:hypothetical protein FRC12_016058 [Ceratobasidium sp. 428]